MPHKSSFGTCATATGSTLAQMVTNVIMSAEFGTTPPRYRNPPIIEAVCEFHFVSGLDWDPTLPGKLHTELADDYPGKPRNQKSIELGVHLQESSPPHFLFGEGSGKVQLITENEKRIVGIGRDVLSIHMLRPYQDLPDSEKIGWDEFRPRISKALSAYWNVAQPQGVKRVGVKYINKLVVSKEVTVVNEYLKCALPEVDGLPNHLVNFMSRVEYAYTDGVKLALSQGTVEDGFILDIDVIMESQEVLGRQDTDTLIDDLRVREREVFEAVITDKARGLFNAS